jgi:hypothetical protein
MLQYIHFIAEDDCLIFFSFFGEWKEIEKHHQYVMIIN